MKQILLVITCILSGSKNDVQEKEIIIYTDGQKPMAIFGTYYKPEKFGKEEDQKVPGVILLHMLNGSRKDWEPFAQKLSKASHPVGEMFGSKGYAVLAIDFRGHGDSIWPKGEEKKKDPKAKVSLQSFAPVDFQDMILDVKAAVKFLREQKEVDRARIAIIGASIGANVALSYVARDEEIDSLVLLSPGVDFKGISTLEAIEKLRLDFPILFIASEDDEYSTKAVKKLHELASGDKKLHLYKKAGHGTKMFGKEDPEQSKLVLEWLNEYVGSAVLRLRIRRPGSPEFIKVGKIECDGKHVGTTDKGTCSRCKGETSSGSMQVCLSCAQKNQYFDECPFCLKITRWKKTR